jgi:hypothetical protein
MRWAFLALVTLAAANGATDPVFAKILFDRWSEKDHQGDFRWETRITQPILSQHQRLIITITVQVDGADLIKRQAQGRLLMLIQLRDRTGQVYQNHGSLSLENIKPESSRNDFAYTQDAFVVPGDYQVSLGIQVSATSEHVVAHRALHVDALHHDPLPEAWRELPAVEFLPAANPPESWYLPSVEGRLNLPVETKRPVRIDLLANGSVTEQLQTTMRPLRHERLGVGELIPAVKVLSRIKVSDGSLRLALLDLERRRVAFEQAVAGDLDWDELKGALAEAEPNKIDVKSLENSGQNAQFFLSEIRRRVSAEGGQPLHVLIVLSGPMAFGKANLSPMEASADPNRKIFYIRYHAMTILRRTPPGFGGLDPARRRGRRSEQDFPYPAPLPADELFGLIKALDPRLFDVTTPEEFRKALATILSEIVRLSRGGG